ncbi:MAG: hypothetical protein ACM31O_04380 [Bacteroidota bacterium]
MRTAFYPIALAAGAVMVSASVASAAPAVGANPAPQSSAVQTVQGVDIYVGPPYGYRAYGVYGNGYGYGYRPYYYGYAPGFYGYGAFNGVAPYAGYPGFYGYGYRSSRAWRELDRKAP